MLCKELVGFNDGSLSGHGKEGGMGMIGGKIGMGEGAFEVQGKTTGAYSIPFDVGKVKAFANMGIHLFLLSVLGGKETLLGTNGWDGERNSVWVKLVCKSSIRIRF